MKKPSKIGKQCQKLFLVINFLSIEKTSKMTMQNDVFLLSPIDNLDDGCWSTFTIYRVQYSHTPQESAYFSEQCVGGLIMFNHLFPSKKGFVAN